MAEGRPIRALLVATATATTAGGEKHVADLLRGLPGHEIEVGLVAPAGGDLADLVAELGVRAWQAPIGRGMSAAGLSAVKRAIADFEPDVVHAHGTRAAMFARLADPLASQRVVYAVHGIHVDKAGSRARQMAFLAVERALKPRTARFVTGAESDIEKGARLRILDRERALTVYNGIELPQLPGVPGRFREECGVGSDALLLLCAGRFHEQKDHATLLSAFALVLRECPQAHLALVGSGELEGALRERAVALGVSGSVTFLPPRPDFSDAYTDADVVVLSSRWEGLPYVIIYAMAHGKPVVSTWVDGIPEAVIDGRTGLLVPPQDPAALAAALTRVVGDPDLAREMGAAGSRVAAERFSVERARDELKRYLGLARC